MNRSLGLFVVVMSITVAIGGGGEVWADDGTDFMSDGDAAKTVGTTQRVLIHFRHDQDTDTKANFDSASAGMDRARIETVRKTIDSALEEIEKTVPASEFDVTRAFILQPTIAAGVSPRALKNLESNPVVRLVEPDRSWRPLTLEGLRLIEADTLHQLGIAGEGTAVAIIDSGIDYLHPTLGGGQIPNAKVVHGLDTADNDNDPMDCLGHGTAVASVAAGSSYQWSPNRRFAGGVAPAAKILAYKVTSDANCGVATTSAVVAAIEDAVLHQYDDDYQLAAINISLGGGEFSGPCDQANEAYALAVNTATDAGITVVAASGNNGFLDALNVPACISRTLSVGSAWDIDPGWIPYRFCLDPECDSQCDDSYRWEGAVSCYSNSSAYLDLVAPSEYLRASDSGGVTVDFGGTSGAAAYVTGAVALVAQALSEPDPMTTKFLLAATGKPTMDDKNSLIRPIVDLAAAVNAAGRVVVSDDSAVPILGSSEGHTISTLYFDRMGPVGHVSVLVDLSHPAPDQLTLTLRSPDGIEVVLHDHGPGVHGIAGAYPDDLNPVESLGRFAGTAMQGEWSLAIEDHRETVSGTGDPILVGWALRIEEPTNPRFEDTTMIYPVVAHTEGSNNTNWRSDVRVFNPTGDREATVRLFLVPPSGSGDGELRQTDVVVPHGSVVALDDIVKSRFGLDSGAGSLLVQDPSFTVVHGTSRTYTTSENGTYGQFVAPGVDGEHSTGIGEQALIILPTAGIDHRVNIGITEITGQHATVAVTLIDSETGVAVGPSAFHVVEPLSNLQINGVLPDTEHPISADPYVAIAVVQGAGRVTGYGSIIDNRTGDAVFIAGEAPQVTPSLLIPVLARKQGHAGTEWRSDLRVLNKGSFSVHVDAELRFLGAFGLPPVIRSFQLQPGQALTLDDVIGSFYGFEEAVGSLLLIPREGPTALVASSRTANHGSSGTYGQFVPAVAAGRGLRGSGVILNVAKGPDIRTNFGIIETDGVSIGVEIELLDEFGRRMGTSTRMAIGGRESIQINDIFEALGASVHPNARIRVVRVSGSGSFFAYASVIDADSGDAIFVPVQDVPTPLAN